MHGRAAVRPRESTLSYSEVGLQGTDLRDENGSAEGQRQTTSAWRQKLGSRRGTATQSARQSPPPTKTAWEWDCPPAPTPPLPGLDLEEGGRTTGERAAVDREGGGAMGHGIVGGRRDRDDGMATTQVMGVGAKRGERRRGHRTTPG